MTTIDQAEARRTGPTAAWSRRVLKVGGYIQLSFAALWLLRGGLSIGGGVGSVVTVVGLVASVAVLAYGIRTTAGVGHRPTDPAARRIERSVTAATVVELVASVAFPVIVTAMGHPDWVLPSIAVTIGPLLLWLDHLLVIPRLRVVGWVLTIGPVLLVAGMSGTALEVTTGLAAGVLLLGTAAAGFHDVAGLRGQRPARSVKASPAS